MKRRTLNLVAVGCIAVGVIGLFLFGFKPMGWWPGSEAAAVMPANAAHAEEHKLYEYHHIIDIDNSLKELNLNAELGDVEVNWHFDGENQIELSGQANPSVIHNIQETIVSNGTLDVNYSGKRQLWENIQLFNFNSNNHKHKVDIHVSQELVLDQLSIDLAMGQLKINDGILRQLEVDSDMGEIALSNVKADLVEMEASMGAIKTTHVDAPMRIKASMGEVNLRDTQQEIKVAADAGSINIVQASSHNIDAASNMGSVTIHVDPEFEGFYDLRASLGDVHAPQAKNKSDQVIKVHADMGSITIME